jgi:RuvB-like protein 2
VIVRCNEENVRLEVDALELLTRIAHESTLRYAMHLITMSSYAAKKRKSLTVQIHDVQRCFHLFIDVQRSTTRLIDSEYSSRYMYNTIHSNPSEYETKDGNCLPEIDLNKNESSTAVTAEADIDMEATTMVEG